MMRRMINMSKKGWGKFVIGAGIGAGLGLLFAPKTGKETRKELKEKIDELMAKAKELDINEVSEGLRAYNAIMDYVKMNSGRFVEVNNNGEYWGFIKDGYVNIIPTVLKNIASRENFSTKGFCEWADDKKLLKHNSKNQNVVRIGDSSNRFYTVKMGYTVEPEPEAEFEEAIQEELPFD